MAAQQIVVVMAIGLIELGWYLSARMKLWWFFGGPLPIVGSANWLLNANEHIERLAKLFKDYGSNVCFWSGLEPCILVGDAELAAQIIQAPLVAMKGSWDTYLQRLTGSGLYQSKDDQLHKNIGTMFSDEEVRSANVHMRIFAEKIYNHANEKPFDVLPLVQNLTMDIILGTKLDTVDNMINFQANNNSEVRTALNSLMFGIGRRLFNPILQRTCVYRFTNSYRNEAYKMETIVDPFFRQILKIRLTKDSNDYISRMLSIDKTKENRNNDTFFRLKSIVISAYANVSSALSFTLLMLAMHPDHQQQIVNEMSTLNLSHQHNWTSADLSKLKHLDRCVRETLRLFPPVAYIERCTNDSRWFGTEHNIDAGTKLIIGVLNIQRNAKYFTYADRFEPDHFRPEQIRLRPTFAYFPFGHGLRSCLGNQCADVVLRLAVVYVLREYRLTADLKKVKDIKLRFDLALTSQTGFFINVEKRNI